MNHYSKTLMIPILAGMVAVSAPAGAQTTPSADTMTAEEIAEAFKKQKTRGLVIVPGAADTDTTEDAAVTAAAAEEYNQVERDAQVNIQISFDFDSAALRADQKPKLAELCKAMKALDVSVYQIIGHTDSSGKASYNERLSLLRAQEVKRHLASDCGIAEDRMKAIGMGETAPFDANDPRADINRRVEFQALG